MPNGREGEGVILFYDIENSACSWLKNIATDPGGAAELPVLDNIGCAGLVLRRHLSFVATRLAESEMFAIAGEKARIARSR